MTRNKCPTLARLYLMCGLLGLSGVTEGAIEATATVNVTVTVTAPTPCVLNNNQPITVEFGEVMTTRVDGNNYRKPVDYTLFCSAAAKNAMKLQIQGIGAGFDPKVLQTEKTGLGIALRQGGVPLDINSWLNFTYPNKPLLEAVPVKQSGITLTGGDFSSGAILKIAYQ
ncbi:type 1 fimbria pilin [Serratia fonticola]|uniref:Type 1 fimbria pilin n=1 Tax=Serratia fonticola TaxID=47917 RepID=A0A542CY30_SERFO|nr:fimbrial protein [Serratia fonticola]TQI82264.1 type 1 fimbria pilin [Serratia fonticola]TQI95716.1 type 1 fimbria pilin [Serratia fonticola]TVZ70212.1 type 1 fimbria pilin [Serratia fonticola]